MKSIDEMIAVMQAYKDGKTIEELYYMDTEWKVVEKPLWNFNNYDYRVKSEPKYVPYDSVDEVEKDKWIKSKATGFLYRIYSIKEDMIYFELGSDDTKELFDLFTYEDGTPCGKLVVDEDGTPWGKVASE